MTRQSKSTNLLLLILTLCWVYTQLSRESGKGSHSLESFREGSSVPDLRAAVVSAFYESQMLLHSLLHCLQLLWYLAYRPCLMRLHRKLAITRLLCGCCRVCTYTHSPDLKWTKLEEASIPQLTMGNMTYFDYLGWLACYKDFVAGSIEIVT